MTGSEEYADAVPRKLLQGLPIYAMIATLLGEYALIHALQPGPGVWVIAGLAFPVIVALVIDRRLRRYHWYPYAREDLEPVDSDCPVCGTSEYYRESGLVPVNRCLNCDAEGVSIHD